MNPFELLKKDHKKVADIFEQFENLEGKKQREDLFEELKENLEVHTHIEETVLYPELKKHEETRDIVLEAYEEHKVVKELLRELDANSKDTDQWNAKLTVLKENVEHHVKEEEGEMFKKIKKVLKKDQLEAIGEELAAEKDRQLVGQPTK